MKLVIASDHAGFELKEEVRAYLAKAGHEVLDLGAYRVEPQDDYPDFAERAEELFERRHEEDRGDVAVALSASRAFLAAGSIGRAVRWLGLGAGRAQTLGRDELAAKLRQKAEVVRKRLS